MNWFDNLISPNHPSKRVRIDLPLPRVPFTPLPQQPPVIPPGYTEIPATTADAQYQQDLLNQQMARQRELMNQQNIQQQPEIQQQTTPPSQYKPYQTDYLANPEGNIMGLLSRDTSLLGFIPQEYNPRWYGRLPNNTGNNWWNNSTQLRPYSETNPSPYDVGYSKW